MKTLGLDFGASFVDAVILDKQKIVFSRSLPREKYSSRWLKALPRYDVMLQAQPKNEFDCLGQGGLFLTQLNSAVVVSCGTGTAVVLAKKKQPAVHLGGTGIGGGSLIGLGQLLLKTRSVAKILALAESGDKTKVDLTVKDILGRGIGLLPPQATAANFAKLKSTNKADLAQGLLSMISETIGLVSCLASQKSGQTRLVFTGRLATNSLVQTYLRSVCRLFQLTPLFPANAHLATAIGAALLAQLNP